MPSKFKFFFDQNLDFVLGKTDDHSASNTPKREDTSANSSVEKSVADSQSPAPSPSKSDSPEQDHNAQDDSDSASSGDRSPSALLQGLKLKAGTDKAHLPQPDLPKPIRSQQSINQAFIDSMKDSKDEAKMLTGNSWNKIKLSKR